MWYKTVRHRTVRLHNGNRHRRLQHYKTVHYRIVLLIHSVEENSCFQVKKNGDAAICGCSIVLHSVLYCLVCTVGTYMYTLVVCLFAHYPVPSQSTIYCLHNRRWAPFLILCHHYRLICHHVSGLRINFTLLWLTRYLLRCRIWSILY